MTVQLVVDGKIVPLSPPGKINSKVARQAALTYLLFLVREIVSKAGIVHFRRYRLLQTPWLAVYVHQILVSDHDKHLHSHPWSFFGVVLRGGYVERLPDRTVERRPGSMGFRRAEEYHKVERLFGPTWSLCVTGPAPGGTPGGTRPRMGSSITKRTGDSRARAGGEPNRQTAWSSWHTDLCSD